MDIIEKAKVFAMAAHSAVGQTRKYTGEPYWVHTQEVAQLVSQVPGCTPEMVAAAHLHDVIEDTGIQPDLILAVFGDRVARLVENLTDVSQPGDGPRRVRKEKDRQHTAASAPEAKSIKLADLLSNSKSIVENDPGFAQVYLKEKALLLEVLQEGDPGLLAEAHKVLEKSWTLLKKDSGHG